MKTCGLKAVRGREAVRAHGRTGVTTRQLGSPTGVRCGPSSAWPLGASFGQPAGLRHREDVRLLLLRLAAAAAVLLTASGCVSLPAGGSLHEPGRAPGGRTVAPARPSPLLLPTQGSSRERLVDVASAGRKPKRPSKSHKGDATPRHATPAPRRQRRVVQAPPHLSHARPARPRPVPARTTPRQGHHAPAPVTARERPRQSRPRPTIDPGVVCRMASGRVRPDLLQLCHRTYGR